MGNAVTRDLILSEIRRCAGENGGKALGRDRFAEMTGIPRFEWSKHWVRWSDAVSEAGLVPNDLQGRTDDEVVLGQLAALVRKLGHIPVEAELRMHRRVDPTFPSHNTFRRFGDKRTLIVRLREYAGADPELADVAGLCEAARSNDVLPVSHDPDTESAAITGHVYLMKSGRHYKIGRSNSVGRRSYEVALQLPERLSVVHSIETDGGSPTGVQTASGSS